MSSGPSIRAARSSSASGPTATTRIGRSRTHGSSNGERPTPPNRGTRSHGSTRTGTTAGGARSRSRTTRTSATCSAVCAPRDGPAHGGIRGRRATSCTCTESSTSTSPLRTGRHMIDDNEKDGGDGRDEHDRSDARDAAHVIGIVVLVALLVAFVVDNTRRVKIGFVFGDRDARLIYVLIVTFVLGIVVDRLWQHWRRRRQRR